METETFDRLEREMMSLYALIIVNIVGAGIAMSLGVATGVNNLIPMMSNGRILPLQTAVTGLALLGFVFAINWLIPSAQLFSGFDDLREEFKDHPEKADDEAMTQAIVRNMAFYRENKPTIEKLRLGSRATGAFFLLSGAAAVLNLLTMGPVEPVSLLMRVVGTLLCIALGLVGVYSPHFFAKYNKTWEQRLMGSAEAEKKLSRILEGI